MVSSTYSHLQITIDVVTVNLLFLQLVPAIYLYVMSKIAEKTKILVECEVSVINKISIGIKYEINSKIFFYKILVPLKKE